MAQQPASEGDDQSVAKSSNALPQHPNSEWDFRSIAELSEGLRSRKISASELLDHSISRIEALDPHLNAIVVRDFDRAKETAKAVDAVLARGEPPRPLLGIPVTVKEPFNMAGLPTTWGFPQFRDFVPSQDSLLVERLRKAGAVIIGKTNIPPGLGDFQSYNEIYGTTNNPWDVSRTPGGSSGGCAASLAAGFQALSIGTDIGGSIRMPAHFTGIYGHKPTLGLVPLRGYNAPPASSSPGHGDLGVAGPMARHALDLDLALDVIAGPDEEWEARAYRLALPRPRHNRLRDFRVFVIDTHPLIPTDTAVRLAIGNLAGQLEKSGIKVGRTSASLPDLSASGRLYMKLLDAARSIRLKPDNFTAAQQMAASLSNDDDRLGAERTRGSVMSHREWLSVNAMRQRLRMQWRAFFDEWDVVIYPAAAVPAFPHDHSEPLEARSLEVDGKLFPYLDACFIWADPASTCGLPATAAPIGQSPAGLPIGVQIIGPYLEDRTPIAFAGHLEREFGGFVPPF